MVVIVAAGMAAYSNSLHGAFVFDDPPSIAENQSIRRLWRLDEVLLPVQRLDYYRPVLNLSLALCYRIGGLDVAAYHVLNLGIHLAAALTLFGLVRRTLLLAPHEDHLSQASTALALVVSLLWMLHPLQTESVTYVIQRCEAMYGLFSLLSLYCVMRGATSSGAWWWYGGAVAACALGMGSKEATAVVPFLVLLYDRTFLASSWRDAFRKRWGLYVALALTWGILVPAILVSALSESRRARDPITVWEYARSQFGVVVHYLRLSLWPDALCLDYQWPVAKSARQIVAPAAFIGVLVATVLWALGRWPKGAFLGAFFLIALAPSSSVVPIPDLAFEHRMYLPLAPLMVAAVLGAYAIMRRLGSTRPSWEPARQALPVVLVVAIAAALGIRTYLRNRDYSSELRIWADTINKAPKNGRARYNFGRALLDAGQAEEAVTQLRQALEIDANYAPTHSNLGLALAQRGKTEEGMIHLRRAIELDPRSAQTLNNLGHSLLETGKTSEAVVQLRKALEIEPNYASAHNNLGRALMLLGQVDEAVVHYQAALAADPDDAQLHHNLSHALVQAGRVGEAIRHCQTALELRKKSTGVRHREYAASLNNLGLMYQSVGDYGRAEDCIRRATEIWQEVLGDKHPDYAAGLRNLASIYRQSGDGERATSVCRKVLEINPGDVQAHCLLGLLLRDQARDQEAVNHWREALRLQPDQVPVLVQAAWVLATSPEAAVRNGNEAVEMAEAQSSCRAKNRPVCSTFWQPPTPSPAASPKRSQPRDALWRWYRPVRRRS